MADETEKTSESSPKKAAPAKKTVQRAHPAEERKVQEAAAEVLAANPIQAGPDRSLDAAPISAIGADAAADAQPVSSGRDMLLDAGPTFVSSVPDAPADDPKES